MSRQRFVPFRLFLPLLALVVSGCATSPPARLYLLNPGPVAKTSFNARSRTTEVNLDVHIPDYLDRPQILVRDGTYRLHLAELDRWAEPLSRMLPRFLGREIAARMAEKNVDVDFLDTGPSDYRIDVSIVRLDGTLGGTLQLEARWRLNPRDGKPGPVRSFATEIRTQGPGIQGLVDAHNRAVQALGAEIGRGLEDACR